MDILITLYVCQDCDEVFNKKDSVTHSNLKDHTIKPVVTGREVKSSLLIEVDDIEPVRRLNSKKVLHKTLKDLIREEREWQSSFLSWIRQEKRRFDYEPIGQRFY